METKKEEGDIVSMDRNSKILLAVFGLAIILSIAASFYRFVVIRDYIIEAQIDCDPVAEACFVWKCDPESEEEGVMCAGNPEEDMWYYKVIRKNAANIPVCDSYSEECEPISCMEGEAECEYVLCEENNEDGVACSNPENFVGEAEPIGLDGGMDTKMKAEEGSAVGGELPLGEISSEDAEPLQ
jgi:hypothetical protein